MNRPEYSLTLDSVICSRCNTISRAEEDTCPNCGADRQGAIFTSKAEAASHARAAAVEPEGDELDDVVDLRDTGWLTRMARRRMVTSYPSLVEPGDELLSGPARKPARKGLAMLVGSVVAGLAAGGYLYTQYDFGGASVKDTTIAAAGAIRDKSASVNDADTTRREELTRARPEPATITPPIAAAPKAEAPRVIVAETKPAVAAPKHVAPTVAMAETRPSTSVKSNPAPAKPAIVAAAKTPEPVVAAPIVTAPPQPPAKIAAATPPATQAHSATVAATSQAVAPVAQPTAQTAANVAPTHNTTVAAAPHVVAPVAQPTAQTTANAAPKAPVAIVANAATKATAATHSTTTLAAATPPKPQKVAEAQPETPNPAVARTIAAVQQSLASRDLSSARRHMRTLRANESRSPEIQQLAAELSRQERARDSALATARTCTMNKEPSCAIRNARRAVALEPRNPQSQTALRQAMVVQTEANTEYFRQASAIPQPVTPAMTFDGRWSVSHRHTTSSDSDRANYTLFGLGVPTVMKGRGDAH
ncbi:hypothetical protein [Caballeronia sp. BR00000012568055]|uniref:hypothetical protein n=1 Tax=Caballeronia sp. BR00000012568055 TaxID=2918761 RepID=UPI0023F8471A|nr:hypothetical protein [Caballeronia sp. BR00000012568055]